MYIKTISKAYTTYEFDASDLFACGDNIRYGTVAISPDDGDPNWPLILGIEPRALGHINISEDVDKVGWVKWAWWWDDAEDHDIAYTVTDGQMFILNDAGSTVERIR